MKKAHEAHEAYEAYKRIVEGGKMGAAIVKEKYGAEHYSKMGKESAKKRKERKNTA